MRSAGFVYPAASRAPDRAPEPMLRPAGGAGCAAAGTPREAFPTFFPSTHAIVEANRHAAGQAFSGYIPRMLLTLTASLVMAIVAVLLVVRLHELDARLAGCAT